MASGRVTAEMLEDYHKNKVGRWYVNKPWYQEATRDAFSHFAQAYGDANPLYRDPDYGKKTRWGDQIAPPTFLYTCRRGAYWTAGLPGVSTLWAGDSWEFYQPIRVGDSIVAKTRYFPLVEKQSEHAGRAWDQPSEILYVKTADKTILARHRYLIKRFERGNTTGSARQKRWEGYQRHVYTKEELEKIDKLYQQETIRGGTPRYWEDVEVGEELPPVLKGPFTATDEIAFFCGAGEPFAFSGKERWEYFRRHPGANVPDRETNTPDVPARIHWEEKMAKRFGAPDYFDAGIQRVCWLGHLVTNWVGDDGFLYKLDMQARGFICYGDMVYCRGRVVRKYVEDNNSLVDLDIWAETQRETTAPGHATVKLPSRERGPVRLSASPLAPADFWS
ncbi:MAG: MaoC family dehydratase N-terminal domain-containing protein [Chloroflexi bacterium]|nr:MaoC family dehydratase N-terminal domain-containing protein [Chloroflexota bacterium]